LYPGTVNEEGLSVLLEEAAGFVTRTTRPDTDEISVDITFPTGLVEIEADGTRRNLTVGVDVEYAPTGTEAWQLVNGGGSAVGSPSEARGMDLLFRTPEVELGGTQLHMARISWG